MSQKRYRYYWYERGGYLHFAESFKAASDHQAIAEIEAMHPDALCEIWHGKTLVAKLPAEPLPA